MPMRFSKALLPKPTMRVIHGLRAERKAGELMREMGKARAGRPPANRSIEATDYRDAKTYGRSRERRTEPRRTSRRSPANTGRG
jgi:hypothetical protein